MYEAMLYLTLAIAVGGMIYAYDVSGDVLHPLMFTSPMLAFLYGWMPLRLYHSGSLAGFFDKDQLIHVQLIYMLGILAFMVGCLAAGTVSRPVAAPPAVPGRGLDRLIIGAFLVGCVGLAAWITAVHNVGGVTEAFSRSYGGGWDESGYIRDSPLLLLGAALLLLAALARRPGSILNCFLLLLFVAPWLTQAILTSRRGPTFALFMVLAMGWFFNRGSRPSLVVMAAAGIGVGYLALFLVTNRGQIHLGSDFELKTDVTSIVETPDAGNEYIYGSGSLLSAERRNNYFWGRRYFAQLLVRPIPTAIWPTKYEDFGVPEMLHNAGTGEGFADVLGWEGAPGSAPGIVSDLWIEASWLAIPLMSLLGWAYGKVWRKAVTGGPAWATQYAILAALSMYLVMQTMEAVIFRTLLLSIPSWLVWKWVLRAHAFEAAGLRAGNGVWDGMVLSQK